MKFGIPKITMYLLFISFMLLLSCNKTEINPPVQKQTEKLTTAALSEKLSILYKDGRYFELREILKSAPIKNNAAVIFYKAVVKCVFDDTDSSIILIDKFFSAADTSATLYLVSAYQLQAFNYLKKDNPGKSSELLRKCLSLFGNRIAKSDRDGILNTCNLHSFEAKLLTRYHQIQPVFEMSLLDKEANRIAVSILINNKEAEFILDTGSDENLISRKYAKEFGIKELNDTLLSSMVYGVKKVHPGIAYKLVIGNLEVTNAPFLIFNDEDLPLKKYSGVIGYPLMRHLVKILIDFKDKKIASTKKELDPINQNLCKSGSGLIIMVKAQVNNLNLFFDTGSYKTDLKESKYTNENNFQTKGTNPKIIPKLELTARNKIFHLNNVFLLDKDAAGIVKTMDGIFGADALMQYSRVYIDFKNLLIEFE
jgi:hypothetical protein